MIKGKKAMFNLRDNWPELSGALFLLVGFIVGISSGSETVIYIVSFMIGSIFGRWWIRFRKKRKEPVAIIMAGAFSGLVLGAFAGFVWGVYPDIRIMVLLFALGFAASYYLHERKLIHSAEY